MTSKTSKSSLWRRILRNLRQKREERPRPEIDAALNDSRSTIYYGSSDERYDDEAFSRNVRVRVGFFKTRQGCLSIPSKAHDETHWPSGAGVFLRNGQRTNQKGAISDKEISATALKIWNSEKDFNVQYYGQTQRNETPRLFAKNQGTLRLDPFFIRLFGFYNARLGIEDPCVRSSACKEAQNRFIENISQNNGPISILHGFLSRRGLYNGDFKAFKGSLQSMWFEPYCRSGGTVLDSSAFEHVFLGEITKNDKKYVVMGLHNWMRMYNEKIQLTEKAKYFPTQEPFVADVKFTWKGYQKAQGSTFFMKKSPAVEMALYTLCFMVRPDKNCSIRFEEGAVNVMAKSFKSKTLIFTAYLEFT